MKFYRIRLPFCIWALFNSLCPGASVRHLYFVPRMSIYPHRFTLYCYQSYYSKGQYCLTWQQQGITLLGRQGFGYSIAEHQYSAHKYLCVQLYSHQVIQFVSVDIVVLLLCRALLSGHCIPESRRKELQAGVAAYCQCAPDNLTRSMIQEVAQTDTRLAYIHTFVYINVL